MTIFLYRAAHDDQVGPWLIPVMSQTKPTGSGADATFSQYFGLNALGGEHGSKQGWGCDSFWTSPQCAVHSVGYTDRYFVAILQLGNGYPDPMRGTATNTALTVQSSRMGPSSGDIVCDSGTGAVYRIAGGAPIYVSNYAAIGGPQPCNWMTSGEIAALPVLPADGTFLRGTTTGAIYRIAGGAPIYVSTFAAFSNWPPYVDVDETAINQAGTGGYYNHLLAHPTDGTFLRGTTTGAIYRIAGGAPIYVSTFAAFGGWQPYVDVDETAIDQAGTGRFTNLSLYPTDGTFLQGLPGQRIYRVVSGVAFYVSSWAPYGGQQPFTAVTQQTVDLAGTGGYYRHLAAVQN